MQFRIISGAAEISPDAIHLVHSSWDDWFKFQTQYSVIYVDADLVRHALGFIKLGHFGLEPARASDPPESGKRMPYPPQEFEQLPESFFSLGQDTSYYEALTAIGDQFRDEVLRALRDVAYDAELLRRAEAESVMRVSLLRYVPLLTVQDQYARLAQGGALLTDYNFVYKQKRSGLSLEFSVRPKSKPPSNIHVLIGRNGVGKSTLLDDLAKALVRRGKREAGKLPRADSPPENGLSISNLVSVSFSAFDLFEPITVPQDRTKGLSYHYVGLKKINQKDEDSLKDHAAISREMSMSIKACLKGSARARWLRAIELLEADPIFAEVGLAYLVQGGDDDEFLALLPELFKRLSSGHKIVLLTITRLVETVVEKTFVLLDEPEAHLHPPLLSAFVRALSDLLTNRNGLAVIATHSPVVLQEVPRSCVWKLYRSGDLMSAERPNLETFGENVGTLTDEIFGLEVTATGFNKVLTEIANESSTYEEALAQLGGQLGAEGRAILRSRMAARNARQHVES